MIDLFFLLSEGVFALETGVAFLISQLCCETRCLVKCVLRNLSRRSFLAIAIAHRFLPKIESILKSEIESDFTQEYFGFENKPYRTPKLFNNDENRGIWKEIQVVPPGRLGRAFT